MKTKNINVKQNLKEYFFEHPTEKLRVRQIERKTKMALPSVIRYARELKKEGFLESEEISGIKVFMADRNSKTFLLEKRFYNINGLIDSGLVEFLINELSNPGIIVFGSFSRGEDIETSDVDIYIETPSKKKIELQKFEKILGKKIQIFSYKNLKEISNPHLANNIVNGVNLNGFVEIFR